MCATCKLPAEWFEALKPGPDSAGDGPLMLKVATLWNETPRIMSLARLRASSWS